MNKLYKQITLNKKIWVILVILFSSVASKTTKNDTELSNTTTNEKVKHNFINCDVDICVSKCCQLDEIFDMTTLQCKKVDYSNDLDFIPNIDEPGAKVVQQKLSDGTVQVDIIKDGHIETKLVIFIPQWPRCENFGPVDASDDGVLLSSGNVHIKSTDEMLTGVGYCYDSKGHGKNSIMLVTCFEVLGETTLDRTKEILMNTGLVVSCISLLVLVILKILLPGGQQLQSLILLSHAVSLFSANLLLLLNRFTSHTWSNNACLSLGILMHFAFLATFFWLNVMCYDIMNSVKSKSTSSQKAVTSERRTFVYYSIYAWGFALLIIMVSIIMHFLPDEWLSEGAIRPRYGHGSCWITSEPIAMTLYFYGIIGVLFFINIILVLNTLRLLKNAGISFSCTLVCCRPCQKKKYNSKVDMFWHRFIIFVMMIMCWVTEVISWLIPSTGGWLVTDFINTLQGFFLLVIFLLNPTHRNKVIKILSCQKLTPEEKAPSTNEPTEVYSIQT